MASRAVTGEGLLGPSVSSPVGHRGLQVPVAATPVRAAGKGRPRAKHDATRRHE